MILCLYSSCVLSDIYRNDCIDVYRVQLSRFASMTTHPRFNSQEEVGIYEALAQVSVMYKVA
jgi:hypothetical protein